jgi:hypothetical protein
VVFEDPESDCHPTDPCDDLPVIDICPGERNVPGQASIDLVRGVLRRPGVVAMAASDPLNLPAIRAAPRPSVPVLIKR